MESTSVSLGKKAGYNTSTGSIPTEPCDVHTGEDLPTIEFEAPTADQEIGQDITVVLSIGTPKGFGSISLTADGKTYTPTANGAYYEAAVTFTTPGEKTIKVTVKDKASQTTTKSIKVIVTGT